jgi:hypothetical protein
VFPMTENPNEKVSTKAQLGMMVGLILGMGVGVSLFTITEDPLWLSFAGVGIALGLGIGAHMDKHGTG